MRDAPFRSRTRSSKLILVGASQIEGSSAFRRHCYPSNGADDIAQVDRSDLLMTVPKNSDGVIASGEKRGSRGRSLAT
jgi:hypothetical protein